MDEESTGSSQALDFTLIGHNIRVTRMLSNLTQDELAERAEVFRTTISRIENGKPIHISNLKKIADSLHRTIDFFTFEKLEHHHKVYLNRKRDRHWISLIDQRKNLPEDSQQQLQNENERLRLGRAGLGPVFHALTFVMPDGPGATFTEIYKQIAFKPSITYKDCLIYCIRGDIRITVLGQSYELTEGDIIGYPASEMATHEPIKEVGPRDLPPLTLYVGANRVGKLPPEESKRGRIRPPKN